MAATATTPTPPWVVGRGVRDGGLIPGVPDPPEQLLETEERRAAKRLPTSDEDGGGDGPRAAMIMPPERRLVLVLDLDSTLLHTIPALQLAPREAYLLRRPPPPEGQAQMFFYTAKTQGYLTKLRPFARTFLREAGAMFELRICTMGIRAYAHHMVRLLDPDGALFTPGDIITREDLKDMDKKGLDDVPGCDERATVILDDMAEVWDKHLDNLVPVRPYEYFVGSVRRGKSYAEMRLDEDDATVGALAKTLDLLRRAHELFAELGTGGDVREVLLRLRKKPELRALRRC